jgi:hypothetical protein
MSVHIRIRNTRVVHRCGTAVCLRACDRGYAETVPSNISKSQPGKLIHHALGNTAPLSPLPTDKLVSLACEQSKTYPMSNLSKHHTEETRCNVEAIQSKKSIKKIDNVQYVGCVVIRHRPESLWLLCRERA